VAGQLACHSPVTGWRGEKTVVRLLRKKAKECRKNFIEEIFQREKEAG
jgi:hypothetical protein